MTRKQAIFRRGTLWNLVLARTERAKKRGALHAIKTTSEFVQQNNLQFLVRIVSSLAKKDREKLEKGFRDARAVNPFLPYDEDLWVTDISQTHICLLNKFNVIAHHILLVTRGFEDQESFLTAEDFEAMWICMAEFDGLGFYNSGPLAGASQRHKHLQVVPLPLASPGVKVPINPALEASLYEKGVGRSPSLPFVHAILPVKPQWLEDRRRGAKETVESYFTMLEAVGLWKAEAKKPLGAYNFLITREWMFLIPRSQECFDQISINSLAFAGAFLVRSIEELQKVKQNGPIPILQQVARVQWPAP